MSLTCTCTLHTPIVSYTVLHSHTLVLTFSPTLTQQSQADTHALILSHILTLHSLALTLTCSLSQCVSHVTHITLTLSLMVLYTHSVSHSLTLILTQSFVLTLTQSHTLTHTHPVLRHGPTTARAAHKRVVRDGGRSGSAF